MSIVPRIHIHRKDAGEEIKRALVSMTHMNLKSEEAPPDQNSIFSRRNIVS